MLGAVQSLAMHSNFYAKKRFKSITYSLLFLFDQYSLYLLLWACNWSVGVLAGKNCFPENLFLEVRYPFLFLNI